MRQDKGTWKNGNIKKESNKAGRKYYKMEVCETKEEGRIQE